MRNPLTSSVTVANSNNNESLNDVFGNRDDRSFSNFSNGSVPRPSAMGHLVANYYHIHNSSRVYPRTDDNTPLASITVTTSASALTFGAWVEITNFDAKTVMADIHHIILGNISGDDD